MKLNETITSAPIIEDVTKVKLPEGVLSCVTYNICNIGKVNANNRIYESDVWEKVLADENIQQKIADRTLFGQGEHPAETQSDLQLTSHIITKMWIDESDNKVYQKMEILDTPTGRILETLLRAGCKVGVSTRAEGDLEEFEIDEADGKKKKCQKVVSDTYHFVTTDFTADPSTDGVEPQKIERNVVETVSALVKEGKMNLVEKKFASRILESVQCKECRCGTGKCKVRNLVSEMELGVPEQHQRKIAKLEESKNVKESVQELIGEIPGINPEDQKILNWAITNKTIPNEFPENGDMIDQLSKFESLEDVGVEDPEGLDLGEIEAVYLKYILLPQAKEAYAEVKESKITEDHGFQKGNLLKDKDGKLWTVSDSDSLSLHLEPISGEGQTDVGEANVKTVDWGNVDGLGLEKVSESELKETWKKSIGKSDSEKSFWELSTDLDWVIVSHDNLKGSKSFNLYHKGDHLGKYGSFEEASKQAMLAMVGESQMKETEAINVYKIVSGSRTGIPEHEVKRDGERYIDKKTGEDVILDKVASGSAKKESKVNENLVPAEDVCPKCGEELIMDQDKKEQYCPVCGYGRPANESKTNERNFLKQKGVVVVVQEHDDGYVVVLKGKGPERILTKYGLDEKEAAVTQGKQYAGSWDIEFKDLTETKVNEKQKQWTVTELNAERKRIIDSDLTDIEKLRQLNDLWDKATEPEPIKKESKNPVKKLSDELIDLKVSEATSKAELEVSLEHLDKAGDVSIVSKILQSKLTEALLKLTQAEAELKGVRSLLEKKAKEVNDVNQKLEESLSNQKKLDVLHAAHQEELTKIANDAIQEGRKQLVKEYFEIKLNEHRLQTDENTRALLEKIQDLQEVDSLMERLVGIARRSALHSKPLTKVQIQEATVDSEQNDADEAVGRMFKRFGG